MGYYITDHEPAVEKPRQKADPPSKKRVWKNFSTTRPRARVFASQPVEPHWEKQPTPTITASGVLYYGFRFLSPSLGRWVNRDPIGEYAFARQFDPSMSYNRDLARRKDEANRYLFVKNTPLVRKDHLGLLCFPGTTKKENESYNPPKNTIAWRFAYVHFEDPFKGDGAGSGVGVYLSYVCHYYRILRKEYDKYQCKLFCWKFEGRFGEGETETCSIEHNTDIESAYDYAPSDAYKEYAGKCREATPNASFDP